MVVILNKNFLTYEKLTENLYFVKAIFNPEFFTILYKPTFKESFADVIILVENE